MKDNNVQIRGLGRWKDIPDAAAESMQYAIDETRENTGLVLNVCLNYGSRREITDAVRSLVQKCLEEGSGIPGEEDITEELVASCLYTAGMPDPDLIIRTGGEKRISNFLLWQSAYSEFIYSDVLWPDFDKEKLMQCIEEFNGRHRRYGGLDKE